LHQAAPLHRKLGNQDISFWVFDLFKAKFVGFVKIGLPFTLVSAAGFTLFVYLVFG